MGTAARTRRSAASILVTRSAADIDPGTATFAATRSESGPTWEVRK